MFARATAGLALGVLALGALACNGAARVPRIAYYERTAPAWKIDVGYYPLKIAAGGGSVLVLDTSANLGFKSSRVLRFDAKSRALLAATVIPRGGSRAAKAAAVVADRTGQAYVAVEGATRTHLLRLSPGAKAGQPEQQAWDAIRGGRYPAGLRLDARGELVLVDGGNHRIIRLAWKGTDPRVLGSSRELDGPRGVAVTRDGAVITKTGKEPVSFVRFDAAGVRRGSFTVPGYTETLAWFYNDLAIGPDGHLYATDYEKGRVLVLSLEGRVLAELKDPAFKGPMGLCFDEAGELLVSDAWAKVVLRFRPVYEKEAAARAKAGTPGPRPPPDAPGPATAPEKPGAPAAGAATSVEERAAAVSD